MKIKVPESHEAYLERGLIHIPSPSETVLFISHQWVSTSHADPRGEQLQVLHEGFRNLMSGEVEIVEAGSDLGSIEKSIVCYAFLVKKRGFFKLIKTKIVHFNAVLKRRQTLLSCARMKLY